MAGHRFPFEKLSKLDDPMRRERIPPNRLVEALQLKPDTTVLDIGVGSGFFALPIAEALKNLKGSGTVIGLDVEPRMLKEFASRAEKAGLQEEVRTVDASESNGSRLHLEPDSVDIAFAAFLYHELDDPEDYLKQVKNTLRPGGRFLVVDWLPDQHLDFGPPADHRVPPDEITAAMNATGFADVRPLSVYDGFCVIEGRRD
jgi:ubiquinone/menaquinone biosynthesis C-methylase UbiE